MPLSVVLPFVLLAVILIGIIVLYAMYRAGT